MAGEHKTQGQILCGFSMETENMLENSRKKLEKKKADMIVANNLKVEGAGFGTDTNVVTLSRTKRQKTAKMTRKKWQWRFSMNRKNFSPLLV